MNLKVWNVFFVRMYEKRNYPVTVRIYTSEYSSAILGSRDVSTQYNYGNRHNYTIYNSCR